MLLLLLLPSRASVPNPHSEETPRNHHARSPIGLWLRESRGLFPLNLPIARSGLSQFKVSKLSRFLAVHSPHGADSEAAAKATSTSPC